MSTSVASVVSHFPEAENGFTTTTAGSVSSGAVTVTLNSVAGYTNGEPVVLVIDPTDAAKKQTFTGIVDTSGVQITSVVWTAGTNQTHALGATVVDYATATHISMISKGIKVSHDQDGTLKAGAVDVTAVIADGIVTRAKLATAVTTELNDGWTTPTQTVSSVTNNGNRSYDVVFNSTVASVLSPGMRLRTTRTVTAPTYMGGLFNGSSHYFIKTTPTSTLSTVTNNFTLMAWVELTSYSLCSIAARADAAVNNSLELGINASGQVRVTVINGGAANVRYVDSYQSLPLNKKTHVAVSWTSGTVVIYFDGVSVPVTAAATGGTAPTTAGTGGDFAVGRRGASSTYYFPGYVSGLGVFDAVLTASTIRSYSSQVLSGSETNCIGAWSLNNTGVNQQAAGTNDLTATGGVSYTVRSPYGTDANGVNAGTTDYELVMKVNGATATVQVPEGCTIPTSGGVSAVAYSTATSPFGFTLDKGRWQVRTHSRILSTSSGTTANTWYGHNIVLSIPVGAFECGYESSFQTNPTASLAGEALITMSTSSSTESDTDFTTWATMANSAAANVSGYGTQAKRTKCLSLTTATPYYLLSNAGANAGTTYIRGDRYLAAMFAIPAGV